MNTARMQQIITELAQKYGLDLTARESALKLKREPYMPLVIEKIGERRVSVAHYFKQNGDSVADPDMEFFISDDGKWIPYAIMQSFFGYQHIVQFNDDGTKIERYAPRAMRELVEFADIWADNIRGQGWLDAEVEYVHNPSDEPHNLGTADLKTQHEYMQWADNADEHEGDDRELCDHCGGDGKVEGWNRSGGWSIATYVECPDCAGTGYRPH